MIGSLKAASTGLMGLVHRRHRCLARVLPLVGQQARLLDLCGVLALPFIIGCPQFVFNRIENALRS
jgi:hypothetical protein